MKQKLKVGQRVLWFETWGTVVTVPVEPWDEYIVKLDSGEMIYAMDYDLITPEDIERLSTSKPILE